MYIIFLKDQPRKVEIKVLSEKGEELISREINNADTPVTIDITELIPGIYLFTAMNDGVVLNSEVIIVKKYRLQA